MINTKFNLIFIFIVYICFFEHKNEASSSMESNGNDIKTNTDLLSLKDKRDVWNLTLISLALFTNNSFSFRNVLPVPSYSTMFIKQENISSELPKPELLLTTMDPLNISSHQLSKSSDNITPPEIFQLVVEKIAHSTRPELGSNLGYRMPDNFMEQVNKIFESYGMKAKSVPSLGSDNVSSHVNDEHSSSKLDNVTDGQLIKVSNPPGNLSENLKNFDMNERKKFIVSNVINEPVSKKDGKLSEKIENKVVKSVRPGANRLNKMRTSTEEVIEENDDDDYSVVEGSGSKSDDSKGVGFSTDQKSVFFKMTTAGDLHRISLMFKEKANPLNRERLSNLIKTIRKDKPEFYKDNLELPLKDGYTYLNKGKNNYLPILYHNLEEKIGSNKNKNYYSDMEDLFNTKNNFVGAYGMEDPGKNYLRLISNYFAKNGLLTDTKNKQSKFSLEKGMNSPIKDIIEAKKPAK